MHYKKIYPYIAFVLAVTVAFASQLSLLFSENYTLLENSVADVGSLNSDSVQFALKDEKSTQPLNSLALSEQAEANEALGKYESSNEMPNGSTAVKPDEILPDTDNIEDVAENEYTEQSGVRIIPIKPNNSIRDSLASVVSQNIYTFSIEERGVILFGFNHSESEKRSCSWYITLYEEYSPDGTGKTVDYRVLEKVAYEHAGEAVQSTAIGVTPGNYRVGVECVSGFISDKYDLAVGFAQADNYETEPNNTKTRYTELSHDVTINGSAGTYGTDETDVDWYMFKITEKGYAVLYFEHEADTAAGSSNYIAWRIQVTDMQGNEYFYTTSGMNKVTLNSGVMGLTEGYYFVTVYSHVFTGVSYALNVSFTPDSAIERELNDSAETATPISINDEIIGSVTERNGISDRDYYSFTMKEDGFVVLSFIHEALNEEKNGWHIMLADKDGNIAYDAVSDWNENIHQSSIVGLAAGDYYILIDSDNIYHSNIIYRLVLLSSSETSWESEPNNSASSADTLQAGSAVNGTLVSSGIDFDKDYYAVTVESEGTLQISFSHIKSEEEKQGWIISIADNEGNVLSSAESAWDSDEITLTANVDAGTYFVIVETGLFFNSDRYVINTVFG